MRQQLYELKDKFFALMFSLTLTWWTVDAIFGANLFLTFFVALLIHSLLFLAMINLRKMGNRGALLFILGSAVFLPAAFLILMETGYSQGTHFLAWILSQSDNGVLIPGFLVGTLLVSAYFFSSTVFYFTSLRYRMSVLFLVGFIPFMINSSKSDKEISIPFIAFMCFFFALFVERSVYKNSGKSKFEFKKDYWYTIAIVLFISVSAAISAIIPKPYTVPQVVYIDSIINQTIQPIGAAMQNAMQNQNNAFRLFNPMAMKRESYITSSGVPVGNRVLFDVDSEEPLYLRVQCWDKYEDNHWSIGDTYMENNYTLDTFARKEGYLNNLVSLIGRIDKMSSTPKTLESFNSVLKYNSTPLKTKKAVITCNTAFNTSFLTPPGVISVQRGKKNNKAVTIAENLVCKGKGVPMLNEKYTVEYVSQNIIPASREFQIVKKLNRNLADAFLDKSNELSLIKDKLVNVDELESIYYTRSEIEAAYKYFTNLPKDLPIRIHDLAKSITAHKDSDYQKALAIQNYFHTSGYKYSLKPPRLPEGMDYNDFFLFESKKGVCVQFASSMVILARACGLPARYVEGYVAKEKDPKTGHYIVRDKYAHAFPEVYIAGYGWMVFEPTVSADDSTEKFIAFFKSIGENFAAFGNFVYKLFISLPIWVRTFFIPIFLIAAVLIIRMIIILRKSVWRRNVIKSQGHKSLESIFKKITVLLNKINLDMKVHETPSGYSARVLEETGIEISDLSEIFNKS
ncbi:MAG: transglutaminase-like domain-containing protein, partial [Bacillota bacterium]|nr:transglutaminase-like domain-containing protein [Bacillota bacterium]